MSELPNELELLRAKADKLGIKYSGNTGVDTLRSKINAAMGEDESPKEEVIDEARALRIAKAKKRVEAKKDAEKLIRIKLTCMNPAKKDWPGEVITVSNKLVGTQKKFIPFTMDDDGYHVPNMMYKALLARKFQQFYTEKLPNGQTTRKGRLVKEFNIAILPALTKQEIKELADAQAQAGGV